MSRRLAVAMIFGGLVLPTAVPAAKAAAPSATTTSVVSNQDKHVAALGKVAPQPVSCAACTLVVQEPADELELPRRISEKAAGRVGMAAGVIAGSALGFAFFGPPGGVVCGAIGSLFGEALGELIAKRLFRPRPLGPWAAPPLRP